MENGSYNKPGLYCWTHGDKRDYCYHHEYVFILTKYPTGHCLMIVKRMAHLL